MTSWQWDKGCLGRKRLRTSKPASFLNLKILLLFSKQCSMLHNRILTGWAFYTQIRTWPNLIGGFGYFRAFRRNQPSMCECQRADSCPKVSLKVKGMSFGEQTHTTEVKLIPKALVEEKRHEFRRKNSYPERRNSEKAWVSESKPIPTEIKLIPKALVEAKRYECQRAEPYLKASLK